MKASSRPNRHVVSEKNVNKEKEKIAKGGGVELEKKKPGGTGVSQVMVREGTRDTHEELRFQLYESFF